MPTRRFATALVTVAAVMLAACAPVREKPGAPAVPQITEAQLRDKAKESLARGMRQYQLGEYEDARKSLTASLDHGLLSKTEQSGARKHLAFVHCISNRERECRDEFRKALEIDPAFDLSPAEAGHPIWGPVYANERAKLAVAAPAAPAAPAASKPRAPRSAGEQLLADGLAKYDAGEFDAAYKLLQRALKEGLAGRPEQLSAHKHSAFSLCLLRRFTPCRNEFMKIFEIDPDFDLAPAEAGHPSWARTYANAKKRAQAARAKKAKDPAAPDAAGRK
jgi:Tfp pilus assembly protein PilF